MRAADPPLIDPRRGDVEDDVSSPKQRSLLAIAGSLLAEISLPKLLFALTFSILLPALLLGFGGIAAELFADTAIRLPPLGPDDVQDMIGALKSSQLLTGFRGSEPIELAPVAALIANLSRAALAYRDRVSEIELNPVILHEDGSGLTIADALITLKG